MASTKPGAAEGVAPAVAVLVGAAEEEEEEEALVVGAVVEQAQVPALPAMPPQSR